MVYAIVRGVVLACHIRVNEASHLTLLCGVSAGNVSASSGCGKRSGGGLYLIAWTLGDHLLPVLNQFCDVPATALTAQQAMLRV
jgi:hypothetical protein